MTQFLYLQSQNLFLPHADPAFSGNNSSSFHLLHFMAYASLFYAYLMESRLASTIDADLYKT